MGRGIAIVCLTIHVNACSLVFVRPAPPVVAPGQPVDCTDSHIFPWIDAIYGIAAVSSIVGGSASSSTSSDVKDAGIPIMSVAAIGLLASAYIGFRRVGRCQDLEDQAAAAYRPPPYPYGYPPPQQQPYPPPYQPPPYQPPPQQPMPQQPAPPSPQ